MEQTPTNTSSSSTPFPTPHSTDDVSIIWQNLDVDNDFSISRKESVGPIERIMVDFARVLELGVLDEVVSVNASKYLFCVTFVWCRLGKEEEGLG
jgi:hypothetical protein